MGNTSSRSPEHSVFQKELTLLNKIVNNIINEKDVFANNDYNFLSQDVCNKYQVVLEEELQKHLKLYIRSLGTSLYIIPKTDDASLTKHKLSKSEVCEKISNHYVKILYIMCLLKYVYNIEQHGDLSIAGIIFRNIRVLDDVMEINFCDLPHKNYQRDGDKYKVDFAKLEGFRFLVDFFLDNKEASAFMGVIKSILGRNTKKQVAHTICSHVQNKNLTPEDIRDLEVLYVSRFGDKLKCTSNDKVDRKPTTNDTKRSISLDIFVDKDNPILAREYCFAPRKVIIKTSSVEGKEIRRMYDKLRYNYKSNIDRITSILGKLVSVKSQNTYVLQDIDRVTLDKIIDEVKLCVKTFYLQSIIDYQNLLDKAKLVPNLEAN